MICISIPPRTLRPPLRPDEDNHPTVEDDILSAGTDGEIHFQDEDPAGFDEEHDPAPEPDEARG